MTSGGCKRSGDRVHLYTLTPETMSLEGRWDALTAWLDGEERRRLERYHDPAHRAQYLLSHALVRWALSIHAGVKPGCWRFRTLSGGRPEIAAPRRHAGLRFSLSHTHGLSVVAVASGARVGADVVDVGKRMDVLGFARRFFHPEEVRLLQQGPARTVRSTFFALWALKEAHGKALGHGVGASLRRTRFEPFVGAARLRDPILHGRSGSSWRLSLQWLSARHLCATARRGYGGSEAVTITNWSDA